jgi:hypothetical protein
MRIGHYEDEILVCEQLARDTPRAMSAQIHLALEADKQSLIGCRSTFSRMCACARESDVGSAKLCRDLARDRFGKRTPTGISGTNEKNFHATLP